MDILRLSTEWAKDEVFSTKFFILFSIMFFIAAVGFWQLGKTDLARAYIYPTLVAGVLLLIIGVGLLYTNQVRLNSFPTAYSEDAQAFLKSEIERADATVAEYKIVLRVVPAIIAIAALLIIFFDKPILRAICITTIGMMIVILFVDGNAGVRMAEYHKQLKSAEID